MAKAKKTAKKTLAKKAPVRKAPIKKVTPKPKAEKATATVVKVADLSGYGTKPYEVGSKVVIKDHIVGCPPRTVAIVKERKQFGALFRVEALGKEFLVWANQLN